MSGDGLPSSTFHDRMALFKGKEKATGNKPPAPQPLRGGGKVDAKRDTPSIEGKPRSDSHDGTEVQISSSSNPSQEETGAKVRRYSHADATINKLPDNKWKQTEKNKLPPPVEVKLNGSSPPRSQGSSPVAATNSVRSKISGFNAQSSGSSGSPQNSENHPQVERKVVGTSKVAALAGMVNVAAISPRSTAMPLKVTQIVSAENKQASTSNHIDDHSLVRMNESDEKNRSSIEVKGDKPSISFTIKEQGTDSDTKKKNGEAVNGAAHPDVTKSLSPKSFLAPSLDMEKSGSSRILDTVKEEDETAELKEDSIDSTPTKELQPTRVDGTVAVQSTIPTEASKAGIPEPLASVTINDTVNAITSPSSSISNTAATTNDVTSSDEQNSKELSETTEVPEHSPSIFFSKRDAKKPIAPIVPSKLGEKTNLISSRISTLALGVNVGALRPDANRTITARKRDVDNLNQVPVIGVADEETRKLLLSQSAPIDQELTHMNLKRASKPYSRPPSMRKMSGDFSVDALHLFSH